METRRLKHRFLCFYAKVIYFRELELLKQKIKSSLYGLDFFYISLKKKENVMKKIAIIGGGIIGMTLANYLDTDKFDISLFDDEKNQATKASAGIISPWLSKRRNKKWYQLAKDGAAFFEKMKNIPP